MQSISLSTAIAGTLARATRSLVATRPLLIIAAAHALLLGGCAVSYYPTTATAPLFTDEGQIHASAAYGFSGVEAQVAVSPVKNFFAAAAGAYDSDTEDNRTETLRYGEIAGGFYFSDLDDFRFEVMLGGGIGSTVGFNDSLLDGGGEWIHVESSYQRYFMQATGGLAIPLGKRSSGSIELGLSTRLSYVHPSSYIEDGEEQDNIMDLIFWEPGLLARAGTANVQAELQFGISAPIFFIADSFLEEPRAFAWQPYFGSIGIRLFFGRPL